MTQNQHARPAEPAFFAHIRSTGIRRSSDRILGGVVGGLADEWGLSRGALRAVTAVAAVVASPIVTLGYVAGWVLLPDEHGHIILESDEFDHEPSSATAS